MRALETLYRSPFGRVMSAIAHGISRVQQPFMVYGFRDPASGSFRKFTRISSNAVIMNRKSLRVADHVWVWHHSILDATEGIEIGEGTQIGAWVGIFTHGSENSIRLLGRQFIDIPNAERRGYTRGAVQIGAYTFIGAGSVILPGTTIGNGCLIGTGTLVSGSIPDRSVVVGWPGQVRSTTDRLDRKFLTKDGTFDQTYYDPEVAAGMRDELLPSRSGMNAKLSMP